jgi:hypothetical protein
MIFRQVFDNTKIGHEDLHGKADRNLNDLWQNTGLLRTCWYIYQQASKIMYNNATLGCITPRWFDCVLKGLPKTIMSELRHVELYSRDLRMMPAFLRAKTGLNLNRLTINNMKNNLRFHVSYPQQCLQLAAIPDWKELEIKCDATAISRRRSSYGYFQPEHDWANNQKTYPDCWDEYLDFPCSVKMLYEDQSSHAEANDPWIEVTHNGKPGGPFKTEKGELIGPNYSGKGTVHIFIRRNGN